MKRNSECISFHDHKYSQKLWRQVIPYCQLLCLMTIILSFIISFSAWLDFSDFIIISALSLLVLFALIKLDARLSQKIVVVRRQPNYDPNPAPKYAYAMDYIKKHTNNEYVLMLEEWRNNEGLSPRLKPLKNPPDKKYQIKKLDLHMDFETCQN